jgi:hypothetical protein
MMDIEGLLDFCLKFLWRIALEYVIAGDIIIVIIIIIINYS